MYPSLVKCVTYHPVNFLRVITPMWWTWDRLVMTPAAGAQVHENHRQLSVISELKKLCCRGSSPTLQKSTNGSFSCMQSWPLANDFNTRCRFSVLILSHQHIEIAQIRASCTWQNLHLHQPLQTFQRPSKHRSTICARTFVQIQFRSWTCTKDQLF